jgi:hypothetical protein
LNTWLACRVSIYCYLHSCNGTNRVVCSPDYVGDFHTRFPIVETSEKS